MCMCPNNYVERGHTAKGLLAPATAAWLRSWVPAQQDSRCFQMSPTCNALCASAGNAKGKSIPKVRVVTQGRLMRSLRKNHQLLATLILVALRGSGVLTARILRGAQGWQPALIDL